ncbi:hypothetical protein NL676_017865 [Syzygium grande]|nr:hypothetical protein NL676_017865 [Syzygium grande]
MKKRQEKRSGQYWPTGGAEGGHRRTLAGSQPQLAGPSSPLPSSLDRLAVRLAPPRAPPSPSLSPPNSSSPPRASPSCSSLRAQLAARLVARQTELVRPAPLAAPDSRVTGVSGVLTAYVRAALEELEVEDNLLQLHNAGDALEDVGVIGNANERVLVVITALVKEKLDEDSETREDAKAALEVTGVESLLVKRTRSLRELTPFWLSHSCGYYRSAAMVDRPPSFVGMIIQSACQPWRRWRTTLGSKSEDLGLEVLDGEVEVDRADD